MHVSISSATAHDRHPEIAQELVTEMECRLRRAKVPVPSTDELRWGYSWTVRVKTISVDDMMANLDLPGNDPDTENETLDNCSVVLSLSFGEGKRLRECRAHISLGQDVTPRDRVPQEIVDVYENPNRVDESFPHVAKFSLKNRRGEDRTNMVVSGYRKEDEVYLNAVEMGDRVSDDYRAFESLYRVSGNRLEWAGGLHETAHERLLAAEEGEVFRYRNKPLVRLTSDEIRDFVQDMEFDFVTQEVEESPEFDHDCPSGPRM